MYVKHECVDKNVLYL